MIVPLPLAGKMVPNIGTDDVVIAIVNRVRLLSRIQLVPRMDKPQEIVLLGLVPVVIAGIEL